MALVLVALALSGCETTAEKSARLESAALQRQRESPQHVQRGLSVTHESTKVRLTATAIVSSAEGSAAILTLRNLSASTLRNVPIEITVRDSHGAVVYTNDVPGLAPSLVSAPLLPAHSTVTWIDDQIQASGTPASVSAKIGEGTSASGSIPRLTIAGAHLSEDATSGAGAEGSVVNRSSIPQQELVVYALALRAGKIVAAGRAILPQAAPGTTTRFQLFFIGESRGARLELSTQPSTLG